MKAALADVQRLRDLRLLLRNTKRRIARLQRLPPYLRRGLERESALASTTSLEIRRLEHRLLESELGFS